MDKQLLKLINRIHHINMPKESIIGTTAMLILSRDVFPSNIDAASFIKNIFGIQLLNYAIRSRTLMCAKTIRHINKLDDETLIKIFSRTREYLNQNNAFNNFDVSKTQQGNKSRKNATNNMSEWIAGSDKKD